MTIQDYTPLIDSLDPKYTKLNEPLSKHTTVGIGGPADIWYEAQTTEDFINAIKKAKELNIPVTILGRGSNVLISDNGIRGLVLKNNSKSIKIADEVEIPNESQNIELTTQNIEARWQSDKEKGTFKYEFKDLDYDESKEPRVEVTLDSGVDMSYAINYLITKEITGLQWYARIPGNLGGWIYNNVHGGTHFINEVVKSVQVLDDNLNVVTLNHDDLTFGYDESRFHKTNEIILSATLNLYKGDAQKAKYVVLEWAKRKAIQPHNSLGSVFKNITNEQKEQFGYPTTATGYIVEHILKMTDFQIGDAAISKAHHNFIENLGHATAADYLAVIKEIQKRAEETVKIKLTPEIFFLGFEPSEIKNVSS